jgi:GAF domain-containing protein
LGFEGQNWGAEQVAFVEALVEQLLLAAENQRLLDRTQRTARREAVLRQTTDTVRAQTDLDALLQSAAQEIRRAIGAKRVAIRLGTEERLLQETPSGPQRPVDQGGVEDA